MNITDKDRKTKYRKLKKYKNKDIYIENHPINELEDVFIKSFNEKVLNKRYEIIYDYMCEYLDEISKNVCDFKCDKCISNRLKKSAHKTFGCCYFRGEGLCKYLINNKCTRPNITCKLFMCEYVERKKLGFKSLPKNYLLLDYFFNMRQKELLRRSFKVKKEELLSKLVDNA